MVKAENIYVYSQGQMMDFSKFLENKIPASVVYNHWSHSLQANAVVESSHMDPHLQIRKG